MGKQDDFEDVSQDAVLLQRVVNGDIEALEHLFTIYRQRVYGFAVHITRDTETAEEVLQDVFYRLWSNASRIDTSLPLLPWLYRVTANASYNRVRRQSFWTVPFHIIAEYMRMPLRRSPEYVAEQRELQTIVRETLDALSPSHRSVLSLYYFQEYSIAEIATILEQPEGTVKSRLYYARKLLKEHIIRRYGTIGMVLDQL
ncbi:MAG: RNA polymerase sigma factor [Chloroflexota bacterium]